MIKTVISVLMLLLGLSGIIFRLVGGGPLTVWGTHIPPNYVLLAGVYLFIFAGLILLRVFTQRSTLHEEDRPTAKTRSS